jgi:hypothetical protein
MRVIPFLFMFMMVLLSGQTLKGATKLDFATVDRLTYRFYQEKKWDSVIVTGKQALRQDIDYYYLRVRMGIAYFEQTEYFPATTHLKKAREFNSGDPFVTNYLYRAYLYTNRQDEARLLRATLPRSDRDSTLASHGFLEQVHVESGYTLSSDRSPGNLATLMGTDSIYGEQDLYGNSFYSNAALKMRVSNRLGFSLAYNYLNFAKTKYVQYGHPETKLDSVSDRPLSRDYFYSFPWTIHDTSFSYHVSQNEACLSASVTLPWGLKVMPAVHWIHVSYNTVSPSYQSDSASDTAYYSKIDGTWHMFTHPVSSYSFSAKDTSFNNYVASLRITKDLGRFSIGLTGSWSNLNGKKQKQAGLSLTYFPFGNLNFYGTTTATGFFQGKDKRLLLSQVIGARITPWMWGEGNFYYGDYTNANIFNGSIVYNNSDIIDYRGGATLVFLAGKHLQFSLIYQYFRKESQQVYYIKSEDSSTHEIKEVQETKNNPYNTHTIIGGITWKL